MRERRKMTDSPPSAGKSRSALSAPGFLSLRTPRFAPAPRCASSFSAETPSPPEKRGNNKYKHGGKNIILETREESFRGGWCPLLCSTYCSREGDGKHEATHAIDPTRKGPPAQCVYRDAFPEKGEGPRHRSGDQTSTYPPIGGLV